MAGITPAKSAACKQKIMNNFFGGGTAIFSKKVPPTILLEWRTFPQDPNCILSIHLTIDTHGGKLFHEVPRDKEDVPDYYFTTQSHTNFIHPGGIVVLSTNWILDSLDAQDYVHAYLIGVEDTLVLANVAPLWSLKSFIGGILRSNKRDIDNENAGQSKKRRLSLAVNEVETALSRLREATVSAAGSIADSTAADINRDGMGGSDFGESEGEHMYRSCHDGLVNQGITQHRIIQQNDVLQRRGIGLRVVPESGDELQDHSKPSIPRKENGPKSYETEYFSEDTEEYRNRKNLDEQEHYINPTGEHHVLLQVNKAKRADGAAVKIRATDEKENKESFKFPEIQEQPGRVKKQPAQDISSIQCDMTTKESSLISRHEDSLPLSSINRTRSKYDDGSPASPPFNAALQKRSPQPPRCLGEPGFVASIHGGEFDSCTDRLHTVPPSTPIKEESPPLSSLCFKSPEPTPRPLFAVERFPQFITPRSPARQTRLESQTKRLLGECENDEFTSVSSDVCLPNLKQSSPQPTDLPVMRAKVWDAKVIEWEENSNTVRLTRVGDSIST